MPIVSVDGEIDHRDVFFSDEQRRENHKLCACVSRAVGTLVLDTDYRPDYGQASPLGGP
jgi:dimethylamine monooxygenase subunit B